MSLAVDPKKVDAFMELARKMGVGSHGYGQVTKSGKFHARYGQKDRKPIWIWNFCTKACRKMKLAAKWNAPKKRRAAFAEPVNFGKSFAQMLSRLNICSKEAVVRQYDHEVQGGSVVKPMVGAQNDGPSDAGIVRPILDSMEGGIVAHGIAHATAISTPTT